MTNKKILTLILLGIMPYIGAQEQEKVALKKRIAELEQKVQDCQQKKVALLKQCDTNGRLQRINNLQSYVNNYEDQRQEKHREISAMQRTIAEDNRQLLSGMNPEQKKQLRQLIREYAKLWRELCKHGQLEGRQPEAFELFFI
jgi:predicted  nucleic acid-binding Zn-ribbon protein